MSRRPSHLLPPSRQLQLLSQARSNLQSGLAKGQQKPTSSPVPHRIPRGMLPIKDGELGPNKLLSRHTPHPPLSPANMGIVSHGNLEKSHICLPFGALELPSPSRRGKCTCTCGNSNDLIHRKEYSTSLTYSSAQSRSRHLSDLQYVHRASAKVPWQY